MTGLDSMSGIVEMLRCGSAWESDLVGPNMSGGPHGLGHISALLLDAVRLVAFTLECVSSIVALRLSCEGQAP